MSINIKNIQQGGDSDTLTLEVDNRTGANVELVVDNLKDGIAFTITNITKDGLTLDSERKEVYYDKSKEMITFA
jgi:phage-related protein|tara:strand:- start:423 stop:644 length:222 start_codon:yes stop_codon:yes gene_type:complete